MGDTSAVLGHFPGAQSGSPSPWYQGLHRARVTRVASRKIFTETNNLKIGRARLRSGAQTCVVHLDDQQKTNRGKLGNTPIIQAGAGWRWTPTQTCQLTTQTGVEEQNILWESSVSRRQNKLFFNFSKFLFRPKTFQSLKYHHIINCCLLQWETCEATMPAHLKFHTSQGTLETDVRCQIWTKSNFINYIINIKYINVLWGFFCLKKQNYSKLF